MVKYKRIIIPNIKKTCLLKYYENALNELNYRFVQNSLKVIIDIK